MDYWDAIDFLLALPDLERFSSGPGGQTMSLEAMRALLEKLGNPQDGRHTIHITGSKGKGSTSTMLASILHESGYRTGLYTSPHLHDYVERINFDMLPVSRFDFADGVVEIRAAIEAIGAGSLGPISTFGAMTALFFHLCRKNQVDWQIVEVGMGGTFDATNVFASKELAVLTAISLEHTAFLGNTCADIARAKAGIVVPGSQTVLARQADSTVKPVVAAICNERRSELICVGDEYVVHPVAHDSNGQSFSLQTPHRKLQLHTAMLGLHQLDNAATAVACMERLQPRFPAITYDAIEDGIANAEIAGRIEQLTLHPITIIDGAHNADSMRALVDTVERHFDFDEAVFILGTNSDKNLAAMLAEIKTMEPKLLIATRSQSMKAMPPEKIAEEASKLGIAVQMTKNLSSAIDLAKEFCEKNDLLCITGSLYVVGEAREIILSLPVSR